MKAETLLKGIILTNGIVFTQEALMLAKKHQAKGQNLCYNLPDTQEALLRPQELFIQNQDDGYETVVSCVAPHKTRPPVTIDANNDCFCIRGIELPFNVANIKIDTVPEPDYYSHVLSNGSIAKEYVSACGYDELNILPWHGCAISRQCAFCGINKVSSLVKHKGKLTASEISKLPQLWNQNESAYLSSLSEAILVARNDKIYSNHLHPIMISGNLSDSLLNFEAEIYARIAKKIVPYLKGYATDGIIAVIEPPPSDDRLLLMKESGIETVVFNIEVACEPWRSDFCPGKNTIAKNYICQRLYDALPIFGKNHVWTNFVFGLEPMDGVLVQSEILAKNGIVPSANVFHSDSGSRLCNYTPPIFEDTLVFFKSLASIYYKYGLKPFYCAKALRTSLSNEAYEGRLEE